MSGSGERRHDEGRWKATWSGHETGPDVEEEEKTPEAGAEEGPGGNGKGKAEGEGETKGVSSRDDNERKEDDGQEDKGGIEGRAEGVVELAEDRDGNSTSLPTPPPSTLSPSTPSPSPSLFPNAKDKYVVPDAPADGEEGSINVLVAHKGRPRLGLGSGSDSGSGSGLRSGLGLELW